MIFTRRTANQNHSYSCASSNPSIYCNTIPTIIIPNRWNPWGMRWCIWLRYCGTSQKAAGSIPNGVIGIFHWHNPSGCTMPLGLTQPLTEMSTRNIFLGGERRPVHRADNLTTFMCRLSWNLGVSTSWNSQGLSRPIMGLLYLLTDEIHNTAFTLKAVGH